MESVKLYGAAYSVYVRIARLAMEELRVPYDLVETDVFSKDGPPSDHWERHPFGKIPAFEHDGFRLFETDAIVQYVIGAFDGLDLLPPAPREHARALQIMRIMDNYAYAALVWGVFVKEAARNPPETLGKDEVARAEKVVAVLDGLMGQPFLAGERLTLADLWAAPMFAYLRLAPSGKAMITKCPKLEFWLDRMLARPSLMATRYPEELAADGKETAATWRELNG